MQVSMVQAHTIGAAESELTVARSRAIVQAFRAIDLISPEAAHQWDRRITAAMSDATQPAVTHELTPSVPLAPAAAEHERAPRLPAIAVPGTADGVYRSWPTVALSMPLLPEATGRLRIIELHPDGVIVLWNQHDVDAAGESLDLYKRVHLDDDRGTAYTLVGTAGNRGRWEHAFAPAVPSEATTLQIALGRDRYSIELPILEQRHAAERPTSGDLDRR